MKSSLMIFECRMKRSVRRKVKGGKNNEKSHEASVKTSGWRFDMGLIKSISTPSRR
jgi:hypothetical protein